MFGCSIAPCLGRTSLLGVLTATWTFGVLMGVLLVWTAYLGLLVCTACLGCRDARLGMHMCFLETPIVMPQPTHEPKALGAAKVVPPCLESKACQRLQIWRVFRE